MAGTMVMNGEIRESLCAAPADLLMNEFRPQHSMSPSAPNVVDTILGEHEFTSEEDQSTVGTTTCPCKNNRAVFVAISTKKMRS